MSLNIKNAHTHAMVRELAELTGTTQSGAVADAVAHRLDELRQRAPQRRFSAADEARRRAAIQRIVADLREETTPQQRRKLADATADLYDENGLPA